MENECGAIRRKPNTSRVVGLFAESYERIKRPHRGIEPWRDSFVFELYPPNILFALYPPLASLIGVRSRTLAIMFFLVFLCVSVFFCVCVAIFILCLLCVSGNRMFLRRTYFGFLR